MTCMSHKGSCLLSWYLPSCLSTPRVQVQAADATEKTLVGSFTKLDFSGSGS